MREEGGIKVPERIGHIAGGKTMSEKDSSATRKKIREKKNSSGKRDNVAEAS